MEPWEKKDKLQRYLLRKLWDCRHIHIKKHISWTTLAVQWLRIHLPMQGIWVRSLVWEDSTCLGASKAMHCNYWSLHPELVLRSKRSHGSEKFIHCNSSSLQSLQLNKDHVEHRRPSTAKNKEIKIIFTKSQNICYGTFYDPNQLPNSYSSRGKSSHWSSECRIWMLGRNCGLCEKKQA